MGAAGMMGLVTIRERGPTPRNFRKVQGECQKAAWLATAAYYHRNLRDKRFTPEHAIEAKYYQRKGEGLPKGSKSYRRSYTGRKERKFGHTRPLEFSGRTRDKVRIATLSSTRSGGRAAYPGANVFNFRHPKSRINMAIEFRRLTNSEGSELAGVFDRELDRQLNQAYIEQTFKV